MNYTECWYKNKCKQQCSQSCIRYNSMHSLFQNSQLPESLWQWSDLSANEDKVAFSQLIKIYNNINTEVNKGTNIYLWSNTCGNGKTSWAVKLMYGYFDSIWHKSGFDCRGLFINVPTFLYNCKRSISQTIDGFEELCNKINEVDLVIWDDIAFSKISGYENQILYNHLDSRINANKSNIFTGNADRNTCEEQIGKRLTSRIFGSDVILEFKGHDRRGDK